MPAKTGSARPDRLAWQSVEWAICPARPGVFGGRAGMGAAPETVKDDGSCVLRDTGSDCGRSLNDGCGAQAGPTNFRGT